ncbi:sulfatase [Neolewinella persica]|uniref:sulfatase n=1 Tax=Neolewinella persica TaxID=70998 RepID=UPI00037C98CF|nr:sulfatase [Neolewinella persica]
MTKYFFPCFLSLLLASCGPASSTSESDGQNIKQPNIIFILADDFGIMDTEGYARYFSGVEAESIYYETPHLNRLMREGTSFSQAYATQLCSPTRAGILSGKFAPRTGFMTAMPLRETYYNQALPVPEGHFSHDVLDHRDNILIERAWDNSTSNSALPTGAPDDNGQDILSIAEAMPGHHSAFIGKWHIGGFGAAGHQPADHGFEPLAWFDGGGSAYYNWRKGWNQKSKARFPDMPQPAWAIGDAGDSTGQAYLTDDLTVQALDYLDDRANKPEEPFFLYFSHFAVHSPYQGKAEEVAHFETKPARGWNGHNDPVYASMIKSLDRSVGQLMEKLKATGLEENTLVVFMSDNGGIDRKITPKGDGTDNAPFLGGKACLTEGGIRVPLIVWWKNRVASGKWVNTPVDYTDLYPTLVAMAGYDAEALIKSEDLDGRSFLPLLQETTQKTYAKDTRYWHYPFNVIYNSPYDGYPLTPHSAIREGNMKLIFDWHGRLHLYDLVKDPYELNDLAQTKPELRQALFDKLLVWLEENVDKRYWPVLNPDYNADEEVRGQAFHNLTATR